MGLLYVMPVSLDEVDRIEQKEESSGIVLKSYGLPLIFWGYLSAILIVLFAMGLSIQNTLSKMLTMDDVINKALALGVIGLFIFIPLSLLVMLFYEKLIEKNGEHLKVTHKIFWVPVWSKKYELNKENPFVINHYLDSPNVAKIENRKGYAAFKNQGYFRLYIQTQASKLILLDRHSRENDLQKIKDLLLSF